MIKHSLTFALVFAGATVALADPPTASSPPVQMTAAAPAPQPLASSSSTASVMASLGPPAIIRLSGLGASVEDLGSAHGLEFWLAMNKDAKGTPIFQTFYTTPDGQALIAGVMFDDRGVDVSALQLAASREGKRLTIDNSSPTSVSSPPQTQASASTSLSASVAPPVGGVASSTTASGASDALVEQIPDSELADLVSPLGATPAQFSKLLTRVAWFRVGDDHLPNLVLVADPHCPVCHKAWQFLGPLVQDRKINVTVILIHGLPETESPTADSIAMLSDPNVSRAWLSGEGNTDGVPFTPPTSAASRQLGTQALQANDNFASLMQVAQTPTVFWNQNGTVMRGHDLGSVIVFMKAVLNGGVSS